VREVARSALIPFSAEQAFSVVADVESYSAFLPWCAESQIVSTEGDQLIGKLTLAKSGIRQSFVTENVLTPPSGMTMALVDGPFQSLEGGWLFEPLGADGVKVSLKLAFEFKSKLLDQTFGRVFSVAADTMVDAFSTEIAKRYG